MIIPSIPKPDFTNINQFPESIDETPKVPQKDMIQVLEESTEDQEKP